MPGRSGRATQAPVLGRPQGLGIVRPSRPEAGRLPGALEVPIDQVGPDPAQPRQDWRHAEGDRRLEDLVASVKEFGILQPLLVRPRDPDEAGSPYQIVAGNRRFVAAQRAGLATVPVVVRATDLITIRILQLTENLQRQDLAPLDEARAFQELMDLKQCSPRELGAQLHVSDQHVRLRLRLLSDQTLADAVERRQIAANTARLIQQLPDDEQIPFRERVRQGERLQENDLAAVRARLTAEGAIHPRRTRPPKAHRGPAMPDPTGGPASSPDRAVPATHAPVAGDPSLSLRGIPAPPAPGDPRASELEEGGQTPFDPMPQYDVGVVHGAGPLTVLLTSAAPRARLLLGRIARDSRVPIDDPTSMEPALRLAGELIHLLATLDTHAAEALRLLMESTDE